MKIVEEQEEKSKSMTNSKAKKEIKDKRNL